MSGVRFAPSPTGSLHVGNFRTAWVSWMFAKKLSLPWVIRFEDIDRPRVVPGAQEQQLEDLKYLGLVPDEVEVQSQFRQKHWSLFEKAIAEGQVYPCFCSRKEIQSALEGVASAPHLAIGSAPPSYSGKCRAPNLEPKELPSTIGWRFRAENPTGCDDFVIARTKPRPGRLDEPDEASFVPAYHWACAIDDELGKYELLVRAADLSAATPVQRAIQAWIAKSEKRESVYSAVFHTALVVQNDGHRLEKRTTGTTLKELRAMGWSADRILERFSASFDLKTLRTPIQSGLVFGEAKSALTLQELGF